MCFVIFGIHVCIDQQFIIIVLTGFTSFVASIRMLWKKVNVLGL